MDFRKPEGQELLTELIAAPGEDAGIFVTNFPAKGWLAAEKLRELRGDLIYLNLTGDRHGGSALDYTVNSKVGLPYLSGDGDVPVNNPFPAWDVIAGQQIAIGLLAAERHRRITGEGQFIKITLADVALATMGHLGYLSEVEVNGEERQRMGNHLFGTFGHDFQCKDGRRVMIVGVSPNQWKAIVMITQSTNQVDSLEQELGLSFRKEGDRFEAREQLRQLFIPWFSQHNYEEVTKAMNEAGVCWGPYQSIQQLVESDIDCSENNPLFDLIEQPGIGPYLMPSQPLNFTALRKLSAKPAPLLGEHTDEILSNLLGLDSSAIGVLHDLGIVAGPEN